MINLRQLTLTQTSNSEPGQIINSASESEKTEISRLQRSAWLLIAWLILLLICSLAFLVWALAAVPSTTVLLIGMCTAAGLSGSTVSVLISMADRLSNGWELESGKKSPENAKKPDMFGRRMIPWFVIRPFLGAVMGLVIYVGLSGGLLMVHVETGSDLAALRLTFLALLAGLFAKSFLESLKRAFAAFVGDKK
ncbi:MAG: hypothetical protein KJ069_20900 [Anaerolineae bacterium]|nr:hypothetical protein [Anaerolineae bacterium]